MTAGHDLRRDIDEVLFTEEQIQERVSELAQQINHDYAGTDLALVTVLRGALFFFADLAASITLPVTLDFMAVSQYAAGNTGGVVRIIKDLDDEILGRHVLVVEDIIDTGLTLNYLLKNLAARSPASLAVCTLLDRPGLRIVDGLPVKYTGFDLEDIFVIGYGLDYHQRYRNLPYIATLKDRVFE